MFPKPEGGFTPATHESHTSASSTAAESYPFRTFRFLTSP